ncbi:hypothetical protein Salat_2557600 [Sesamum alatum]|uniref:Uncharacterized protein n=1 Tax=Sesamum alatum TaxID=300844 RepID=A0AAE2CCS9_9LAMI|nr:hypothetical protein Salat_2557600 [Sesamum alatum]
MGGATRSLDGGEGSPGGGNGLVASIWPETDRRRRMAMCVRTHTPRGVEKLHVMQARPREEKAVIQSEGQRGSGGAVAGESHVRCGGKRGSEFAFPNRELYYFSKLQPFPFLFESVSAY